MITFLGALPVMMNPPMSALSPVPTERRVAMLPSSVGGAAVGEGVVVGAGVAVPLGVGVAVAVGFGVAVAVGFGVAVAVGTGVGVAVGFGVGVAVGFGVGVAVGFGVGVAVGLGVAVAVGTGVAVGGGVGGWMPGAMIETVIGAPVLKNPIVAFVACGGVLESKRKLYIVPQRIAVAFCLVVKVSLCQV